MANADKKTCTQCDELRPITDFHKQGKYRRARCKFCTKGENAGAYGRLTPVSKARYAEAARIRKYGLSNEALIDLMLVQDFCCAICSKPMSKMNIDHDHDTDQVRGLLCSGCNTGLGKLGDDIEGLRRALRYLERSNDVHA